MKWFQLHNDSIGALSSLMLCLTATLYLLSIRNKSKDGRRIMGIFIFFVFIHLLGFIITSSVEASWNTYFQKGQCLMSSIYIVYLLWVIYVYRQNPFPRELRHVLIVSGLLFAVSWYVEPRVWLLTAPLHVLSFLWIFWVLVRKALKGPQAISILDQNSSAADGDNSTHSIQNGELKRWWPALKNEFQHPTNRLSKSYRSLALWSLINFLFFFHISMDAAGLSYNYEFWNFNHHVLLLITIIWLIISYINYAEERTTFMAKLVALFLCLTLILLGLVGFLLYNEAAASGLIKNQHQKGLKTLAILILIATLFMMVIIPFFLRSNLLQPLNQVLNGVKGVNEGDLTKKVDVAVNDEIGYLGQSFNHMTESLRRYSNEMESLVSQRTAELQQQTEYLNNTLENLKATQTQLVHSAKMASLGELTAGIAHEIQNPLNFVNNFSEINKELLIEMKEEMDKGNVDEAKIIANEVIENQEKVNHHGKRADAIVKGMLQHSRTSSNKKEATNINALADEYLRLIYHGARAKDKDFNVTMKTDFDASIGHINIIPQDIGRVLLNLYNNAFYAVKEKRTQHEEGYVPTVSVSTKKIDGIVEIKVADNGNGIPQKILDKIFQPFFTTKPTGQGTGLGLSLSYDIVKAHGGEIRVGSKESEDSEFIVRLPYTA